jgi:hypothetical protein
MTYEKPVLERYGTFQEVTLVLDGLCVSEITSEVLEPAGSGPASEDRT